VDRIVPIDAMAHTFAKLARQRAVTR